MSSIVAGIVAFCGFSAQPSSVKCRCPGFVVAATGPFASKLAPTTVDCAHRPQCGASLLATGQAPQPQRSRQRYLHLARPHPHNLGHEPAHPRRQCPGRLPPRRQRLVQQHFRDGHRRPGPGVAVDPPAPLDPDRRAHRFRQDPHRVPRRASTTWSTVAWKPSKACRTKPWWSTFRRSRRCPTTSGSTCKTRWPASPNSCGDGPARVAHQHRRAHRRYTAKRPLGDAQDRAAHSGHHPGIAVRAARLRLRPANARHHTHGDRRRNPCHRRQQARQPPGPEPGTLAGPVRRTAGAHRPVGHAKTHRSGVAFSGRPRSGPARSSTSATPAHETWASKCRPCRCRR